MARIALRLSLALVIAAISVWAVCLDCPRTHHCCKSSGECGVTECIEQSSERPAPDMPVVPALIEAPLAVLFESAPATIEIVSAPPLPNLSPPPLVSLRI